MAPTNSAKKPKEKKEKLFHPQSRKAGQIERVQLRKFKLKDAAGKRMKGRVSEIDRFVFFYHAMPPEKDFLSLEELHAIIRDVWLTRHDATLEEERVARRKGRPKSAREIKLEEVQLVEREEYRTGMEVPDLTHPQTVEIFRRWDQTEMAFIQLLRFIRISSENPSAVVVSRPGKHGSIIRAPILESSQEEGMTVDEALP